MRTLALISSFTVLAACTATAATADELKLDFGDKEKGKPQATDKGIISSGRAVVPAGFEKAKVVVLVRERGKQGYRVYEKEVKFEKDAWAFDSGKVKPGTYQVRVRLSATEQASGADTSVELPDFGDKPNYIEVEVK